MRTLSTTAIAEKNKLATTSVFLILAKVTIPGVVTPVRVAANNESVSWDGETWLPVPFELDEIGEESKGEVPQVVLRIGNAARTMEQYVQAYDTYCKTNGYASIEVEIYVVNSLNLGSATPETTHQFELKQPKTDASWVYFVLGAPNPFNRRAPLARVLRNHCRWIFKSTECGYTGASTSCNKTITACRAMAGGSHTTRFGGFPGVGNRGVRVHE